MHPLGTSRRGRRRSAWRLEGMGENERPAGENGTLPAAGRRGEALEEKERLYASKIDALIEQLQAGGFPKGKQPRRPTAKPKDLDHPYYQHYRDLDKLRSYRINTAKRQLDYSREAVQRSFELDEQQQRLQFAVHASAL